MLFRSTLFPYTTLFLSQASRLRRLHRRVMHILEVISSRLQQRGGHCSGAAARSLVRRWISSEGRNGVAGCDGARFWGESGEAFWGNFLRGELVARPTAVVMDA